MPFMGLSMQRRARFSIRGGNEHTFFYLYNSLEIITYLLMVERNGMQFYKQGGRELLQYLYCAGLE